MSLYLRSLSDKTALLSLRSDEDKLSSTIQLFGNVILGQEVAAIQRILGKVSLYGDVALGLYGDGLQDIQEKVSLEGVTYMGSYVRGSIYHPSPIDIYAIAAILDFFYQEDEE